MSRVAKIMGQMDLMKIDLDKQETTEQKNIIRGLMKTLIKRIPEAKRLDDEEVKTQKEVKPQEEEEDVVKRITFEGENYLKSKKTGVIYNMDEEEVGLWNEATKSIDFGEPDSDEEEVVKKFTFEGKKYLRGKTSGTIYNLDEERIGVWNENKNRIDYDDAEPDSGDEQYKMYKMDIGKNYSVKFISIDYYDNNDDEDEIKLLNEIPENLYVSEKTFKMKETTYKYTATIDDEDTELTGVIAFDDDEDGWVYIEANDFPLMAQFFGRASTKKLRKELLDEEEIVQEKVQEKDFPDTGVVSIPYNRKTGVGLNNSCWKGYEAIGLKKKGKKLVPNCVPRYGGKLKGMTNEVEKRKELLQYSDPKKALENAIKYLKKDIVFSLSTKPKKKYMVMNPDTMKWTHFGEIGYEDFLKHQDPIRQKNYLKRTANMKGNWKNDKYSANNLAREILWR